MKNKRFIKTKTILPVVKTHDSTAYIVEHVKKYTYQSAAACSCCKDWIIEIKGFILYTSLNNKQLRELGVKSNSIKNVYRSY